MNGSGCIVVFRCVGGILDDVLWIVDSCWNVIFSVSVVWL